MTVDEELAKLEDDIRRLKIEYDIYLNGGSQRPPHDTVSRVEKTLKRYAGEAAKLSLSQRFRFQSLQQKYVLHRDVWQRKIRDKEEGRGRFASQKVDAEVQGADGPFRVVFSDPVKEKDGVDSLLQAVVQAKQRAGEAVDNIDPAAFAKFVREKSSQIKSSLGCEKVQFSVTVEDGKVKLKAFKAD